MGCSFPAKEIVELRREMVAEADKTEDQAKIRAAMEFCLASDRLRFAHEDFSGCKCWYAAVQP